MSGGRQKRRTEGRAEHRGSVPLSAAGTSKHPAGALTVCLHSTRIIRPIKELIELEDNRCLVVSVNAEPIDVILEHISIAIDSLSRLCHQFALSDGRMIPLRSKYPSQHPVLKHPQSMSLP
jgi:hypothetical protein